MKAQLIEALRQHNSDLANNNKGILTAARLSFTDDRSPAVTGGLVLSHDAMHFVTTHKKPQVLYYETMHKAMRGKSGADLSIFGADMSEGPYRLDILPGNRHTDIEALKNGLRENFVPFRRNLRGFIAFLVVAAIIVFAAVSLWGHIAELGERFVEEFLDSFGSPVGTHEYNDTFVYGDTYEMDGFRITFVSAHPCVFIGQDIVYIFYDYEALSATRGVLHSPIGRYPRDPLFVVYQGDVALARRMSIPARFADDYGRSLLSRAGEMAAGDIFHAATSLDLRDTTTPITIVRYNPRGVVTFMHEIPLTPLTR